MPHEPETLSNSSVVELARYETCELRGAPQSQPLNMDLRVFIEVTNSSYSIDKPPRITAMCSESEIIHPMETRELTRALIQSRYSEIGVDPFEVL